MSALRTPTSARDRLIFPLDVPDKKTALGLVEQLHRDVGVFKVGKQLFVQAGPEIVRAIQDRQCEVFLDLKFHDIPKTTALASVEAARLGVKMFTLHASGGGEMLRAASDAVDACCAKENLPRPLLLAVTALTSLSREDLESIGITCSIEDHVARLARLACVSSGIASTFTFKAPCSRRQLLYLLFCLPQQNSNNEHHLVDIHYHFYLWKVNDQGSNKMQVRRQQSI